MQKINFLTNSRFQRPFPKPRERLLSFYKHKYSRLPLHIHSPLGKETQLLEGRVQLFSLIIKDPAVILRNF
ncbi:hypothetical protein CEE35_01280 [Candidatus Aerophobetes bacterium Ae_b3b]|nr:MAG: hypothetical protein CEE35_01280 [Candidatus Aerophobetes bacterium Ae_b3b]